MFYSHEVLTNRKYGVATVWLVATLGAKSSLKKITRKQMLDVDVAKACKTIIDPAAPMALRLQGNLLYGVSRVYLQQCGYVLADAQSAHNTMMLMLRSVQNYALDPDAGKARREQLILQDDPSFLPEFALPPPDFLTSVHPGLSIEMPRSGESQSLTPFGTQQSSQSSHVGELGLVLPSSTPDRTVGGGLEGDNGIRGNIEMLDVDNMLQLDDPDFAFGEDGDIIEFTPGPRSAPAPATPAATGRAPVHSDADASARVRREHEEGQQRGDQLATGEPMDLDLPTYGEDMPRPEGSPTAVGRDPSERPQVIESSSSIAAPMRRKKRAAKVLPKDTLLELRNKELLSWKSDYLKNMKDAAKSKIKHHIQQRAKKNAEQYVWGHGIGGLGRDPIVARGPLSQFIGDDLFQLFTGMSRTAKVTSKRHRDSGIDEATQEEARRKRQKIEETEGHVGRAEDDEGLLTIGGDEEVEIPREAGSALDDQQLFSAMPWNISASKRGSSAIPLSGRVTMTSDQGKQGSRVGSRMVSASPLLRRSTGHPGDFEALQSLYSDSLGGEEVPYAVLTSDPVQADEDTMQPSLRVREALSAEGGNFFAFVAEAITEKRERLLIDKADVPDGEIVEVNKLTFEELLPPPETSRMVACQGFMMILTLGTKGMLDVRQPVAFNDITLHLTEKTKVLRVAEGKNDDDGSSQKDQEVEVVSVQDGADEDESSTTLAGSDIEMPELDDSHFQEQMAAGHATAGGDDHDQDSLYDTH